MVRFYWRSDIRKKAKIMRRIKFPFELDALDLCTPSLKEKLLPVNTKMKEIEREGRERRKVRRKTKKFVGDATIGGGEVRGMLADSGDSAPPHVPGTASASVEEDVTMADAPPVSGAEGAEGKGKGKPGDDLEPESYYLEKEKKALEAVMDEGVRNDLGASVSGLYDLYGIVTHKGASADSGHYMGYVRCPASEEDKEDDEGWYKFDDEKVSPVRREQITALEGGGEDSVAYILLYRARELS